MIRLFVALALPDPVRGALADLEIGIPGTHWVEIDNLHLTLRFIGEVPPPDADDIADALADVGGPAFDITLTGIDTFRTARRTRALWAGVAPSAPLRRLQTAVDSAVVRAGQPPARRKFKPHVTLARCANPAEDRVARFIQDNNRLAIGPVDIDGFCLFSSRLGRSGPTYTVEAAYDLDPPA